MITHRQRADDEDDHNRYAHRCPLADQLIRHQKQNSTHQTSGSVDLLAKNKWYFSRKHIPDHPTKSGRNHPQQDTNYRREAKVQSFLQTQDGVQCNPDGIKEEHAPTKLSEVWTKQISKYHCSHDDVQINSVLHPANGSAANQKIAQGPAANRRHQPKNKNAKHVKFALHPRQCAGDSKYEGASVVDGEDEEFHVGEFVVW